METALQLRGEDKPARVPPAATAARHQQGKAWCKCGGQTGGLVPSWFGRDCIEAGCPLKTRGGPC